MKKIVTLAMIAAGMVASPALAKKGDVLVRARAIIVAPTEKATPITGIPGSDLGVSNSVMPEVDFTYMVTNHIGAELILATTKHDVTGRGSISALGKVADTWVLPPTLTVQYHFAPDAKVRPYVGVGVNYSIFYSSKAAPSLNAALGSTAVKLDDSFGYALQAGVDVDITPKVFLNLDVKYIDMTTTARLTSGGTLRTSKVNINPIVAGIGVGFRF
ncbi:MAG: OmpW family protein [Pseudomonadota bacterium]